MASLYEVLGLQSDCSPEEIKAAFRRLAHQFHPDKNNGSGQASEFMRVKEAYDVLSDPQKRTAYDLVRMMRPARPAKGELLTREEVAARAEQIAERVGTQAREYVNVQVVGEFVEQLIGNEAIFSSTTQADMRTIERIVRAIFKLLRFYQEDGRKYVIDRVVSNMGGTEQIRQRVEDWYKEVRDAQSSSMFMNNVLAACLLIVIFWIAYKCTT